VFFHWEIPTNSFIVISETLSDCVLRNIDRELTIGDINDQPINREKLTSPDGREHTAISWTAC